MYPVLFTIGGVSFYTFGVFLALAFLAAFKFGKNLIITKNIDCKLPKRDFFLFLVVFIVSGRLLDIIFYLQFYTQSPLSFLEIYDGGFSFLGAFLSLLIFIFFKYKKERQIFYQWIEVFFVSFLSFMFFIEFGRFFSGLTFGTETDMPWGVIMENVSIGLIVPLHPVQIYSAISIFTIFSIFYKRILNSRNNPTLVFIGLVVLGFSFFVNGFLRGDQPLILFSLNPSQIYSLLIIIFASYLYFSSILHKR